jgi:hypothetical protein
MAGRKGWIFNWIYLVLGYIFKVNEVVGGKRTGADWHLWLPWDSANEDQSDRDGIPRKGNAQVPVAACDCLGGCYGRRGRSAA